MEGLKERLLAFFCITLEKIKFLWQNGIMSLSIGMVKTQLDIELMG